MANLLHGVFQNADAPDFNAHDIACLEKARRVEANADARRRSRGNDVACAECYPAEIAAMIVGMSKIRYRVLEL